MNLKKIFLFIFLMFFLTACENNSNTNENNQTSIDNIKNLQLSNIQGKNNSTKKEDNISPKQGGTLTFSMRIPKTFNPLKNEDYTVDNILKLIFEPLFIIDENFNANPNLISDFKFSDDRKTLTLYIKNDIYWHDGVSLKAEDIIFSLDTIKDNPNSIYSYVLNNIENYSVKGGQVVIQYKEPFYFALYNLCFPIIPKHYYKNSGSNIDFKPVGNGPFKYSSYEISSKLILEGTPNFNGSPYIEKIEVLITSDRNTDLQAFERNILSAINVNFSEWGKLNFNRNKLDFKFITNNFEFLGFNFKIPLYQNIQFKKAIAYSIPKDEIISTILLNSATKTITPINPKAWYTSYKQISKLDYSLEKAIKSLSLANLNLSDVKTKILVNSENVDRIEIAKIISKRLAQIGIDAFVDVKPFDEYLLTIKNGDYHMFLGGIDFGISPNFKSFLSSSGTGDLGINFFNFSDSKMDTILEQLISSTSDEQFKERVFEFESYFVENLPFVGLFFKNDILLTDNLIIGEKMPTLYNQFNNIQNWFIK